MKLKRYQEETLDALRRFFEEARIAGPAAAYATITEEPDQAARLRGYVAGYKPLEPLPEVPSVCLRLPTGGGKTILATHAIAVARDAWVERDFPMVLWLVPTNTIRSQTAEALKDTSHPYRNVLNEAFGGRVRIFDIGEFAQITPHDLRSSLCVVVGTIQTLRVTNTHGRRVYAHHEMLEPHFSGIPPDASGLERSGSEPGKGDIRFSFANLMHIQRPLVIMDEAHKARTRLTRDVHERINPSALIEFTATPKAFNNVLHSVSAQELKDEEMIKMPVMLDEADTWQGAVSSAILKRAELQECANRDREGYIRPIVLFQAQKRNEEVTVDVLKRHLIEQENVAGHRIAVATGAQRELDRVNLFDPACPVEYVITVEALKEGWDCSFAYVFCSLANIRSSTDAEQLLGRVLRMPYATQRRAPALNRSYARLVSRRFAEAANALRDRLVGMGFEEGEAEANIEAERPELGNGLFGRQARTPPKLTVDVDASKDEIREVMAAAPDRIKVSTLDEGKARIEFVGVPRPQEEQRLYRVIPTRLHGALRGKLAEFKRANPDWLAPAHLGETFVAPRLVAQVQGELVFGDSDVFVEDHVWLLADHPARLTPEEFDITETTHTFKIDVYGKRLHLSAVDSSADLLLDVDVDGWTQSGLVCWLDGKLRDPWISQPELLAWLDGVVTHLPRDRGLPLAQLMRCRFILARTLKDRIKEIRQEERGKVYQMTLFGPEAHVEVSFEDGHKFFDGMYADVPRYRGGIRFRRHFLGPDEVPAFDGSEDGEEAQCAMVIDSLPGLKHWTRNVSRHRHAFHLPTATDRFYPDFVALMEDGRVLVVEYKGSDRSPDESRDSREKERIGRLWAMASGGRAVFVMATMKRGDPNEIRTVLIDALREGAFAET